MSKPSKIVFSFVLAICIITNCFSQAALKSIPQKEVCNCEPSLIKHYFSADLRFYNHESQQKKNDSLFLYWSQDSLVDNITSLKFSYFDTIPAKFSVFKEVKNLRIENRSAKTIYGFDLFPKLKIVEFWASKIDLSENTDWLERLEVLHLAKTQIIGLRSFKPLQNLKTLYGGFSSFDTFPLEIEKMPCLTEITFGAYMGEIDLGKINLSQNTCLKIVEFQTWRNNLIGIPKGLENLPLEKLNISHQKLTEKEKYFLKGL